MEINEGVRREFTALIKDAYRLSVDVGHDVEEVLRAGLEQPLTRDEAVQLLKKVIGVLKESAEKKGDAAAVKSLEGDVDALAEELAAGRHWGDAGVLPNGKRRVELKGKKDVPVNVVRPEPYFHTRRVPMYGGFVKTTDIELWQENDRLDIHLNQFRQVRSREPDSGEVLNIMLSQMDLPGLSVKDEFMIVELARSIAVNGVRKPPIIDIDGTLLDGNRRVAACYYILNSKDFTTEQKQRVQEVYVWQLTETATADDRYAVVTSLNFEPDHKQDWPEYVKARKVASEWEAMLATSPTVPGPERQRELKKELSQRFALGPDTRVVNRYLTMVRWADEFEDYLRDKGADEYAVKHRANKVFQYFDELAKGTGPGGVAYTLNQDEDFKHLVFDLLYQGKFQNFTLVRALKHYNDDVFEGLSEARAEKDVDVAQKLVKDVLTGAEANANENRKNALPNTRILEFVKFLVGLSHEDFREKVRPETLQALLEALELVQGTVRQRMEKLAAQGAV